MQKQTVFYAFLLIIFAGILFPGTALCELQAMDDSELSGVYAAGFSNFSFGTINGNEYAKFWLNIHLDTYTEIESLKLGYHDEYDYKETDPSFGWDQDWENVRIGADYEDPSSDFHAEGFYFQAEFQNIDDADTRELKEVTFGFDYVQGEIYADFINFSGTIDDGDGSPEYNGHILNLGPMTITADPGGVDGTGGFEISLSIDDYDKGYWVTFDNAVVTP